MKTKQTEEMEEAAFDSNLFSEPVTHSKSQTSGTVRKVAKMMQRHDVIGYKNRGLTDKTLAQIVEMADYKVRDLNKKLLWNKPEFASIENEQPKSLWKQREGLFQHVDINAQECSFKASHPIGKDKIIVEGWKTVKTPVTCDLCGSTKHFIVMRDKVGGKRVLIFYCGKCGGTRWLGIPAGEANKEKWKSFPSEVEPGLPASKADRDRRWKWVEAFYGNRANDIKRGDKK